MNEQIVINTSNSWEMVTTNTCWVDALEDGKVLHFTQLPFLLSKEEQSLLKPELLNKKKRNISLNQSNTLTGMVGEEPQLQIVTKLLERFRENATTLITSLAPDYQQKLCIAATSFRPVMVESRKQSVRANDKLLHFDAFPTRPNYGERIIRVFININPENIPRVWRVGGPFETVVKKYLPKVKPYSIWQAKLLQKLHITKSFRSEYDHIMLQIHDLMKLDNDFQANSPQTTVEFTSGSVWVCLSDQVSHAVNSGQYMMEQTFNLPVCAQYHPEKSPLAVLQGLTNKTLI